MNGGSGPDGTFTKGQVRYGTTIVTPTAPGNILKDGQGYVFDKWYTNAACTRPLADGAAVTNDMEIYAGWKEDPDFATYDLWIAGIQVNSYNASNVLSDAGDKASVSYDPDTKTLYLDDADIVYDKDEHFDVRQEVTAAIFGKDELNISLKGSSTVRNNGTGPTAISFAGIFTYDKLVIEGESGAELTVSTNDCESKNNYGVISGSGGLDKMEIYNVTLNAYAGKAGKDGASYGLDWYPGTSLIMHEGSVIRAKGHTFSMIRDIVSYRENWSYPYGYPYSIIKKLSEEYDGEMSVPLKDNGEVDNSLQSWGATLRKYKSVEVAYLA